MSQRIESFLKKIGLLTACCSLLSALAASAPWTGIIDATRAADWTQAGVVGGIPNRTTVCATLNPGATAAQINTAITNCPSGQVVKLNAGTYTIADGGVVMKSGVTLRGAGADQTQLVFNSLNACGGAWTAVCMEGGDSSDYWQNAKMQPGGTNAALWTGGYTQGATQITLSNVGSSGIQVGAYLYLDQDNDTAVTSGLFQCETTAASPPCSLEGGANDPGRIVNGIARQQVQIVKVTAINGNTYTITPGLIAPNWRSSQHPGAWWSAQMIDSAGVEDLSIQVTQTAGGNNNIAFANAINSWVKGVRLVRNITDTGYVISFGVATHCTIQDNYVYGTQGQSINYGVVSYVATQNLVQNNIFQHTVAPLLLHSNTASVYAYNYAINDSYDDGGQPLFHWMIPMIGEHSGGVMYNLFEGNIGPGMGADAFHGNSVMNTAFRNYFLGLDPGRIDSTSAINMISYNRYFNYVGNVLGTPNYHTTYQAVGGTGGTKIIFNIGSGNSEGSNVIPDDPLVASTMLRWGNWDVVTQGARFLSSEVPSALSQFANAVPASQTLPGSFFLSSKPDWWPTGKAWPPVGPDVSGGNIANLSGHANTLPAEDCYRNVMGGPADGSGAVLNFNAASCYGTVTPPPPNNPPTVATAAAATPSPVTGTTANLSVLGADDNGEPALTYTWTTTGTPPAISTFTVNGSNAAKNTTATFTKAGTYTFQVTIQDAGNLTVTSSVNVTVNQTLTTVSVLPLTATVQVSGTQSFTASGKDQFAKAMSVAPTWTWTTTGGSIDSSGLFTAGSSAGGPFTVRAASAGKSATAQVTVTAMVPPTVSLTSPANGDTFIAPATIALGAMVTAGTNGIANVQFWHDGTLLATDNASPYTFVWTNVPAGTYQITAIVTDTQGLTNPSLTATVTVNAVSGNPPPTNPPTNPLPTLDLSGLDFRTFLLTDTLSFNYAGSGATFAWDFEASPALRAPSPDGGGPSAARGEATSAATTSVPRFTPLGAGLSPGSYQLTITVTQNGQTQSATATVTLVQAGLSGLKVYPNPWRSDKHAAHPTITFDGVTLGTTIKIFTVSAHEVKELHTDGPKITWDLANDSGDKVASGVYLYVVTDRQGDKVRGKVAVIK